ncbi:xylonolactonase [Burkholderiales bacterium]|nr:xylonolactonase [Burkholderiales bacterium]
MTRSHAMPASPFSCALDIKASLGECPQWSVAEQALYFVDINAPSLNRFDPASGTVVAMSMPSSIGCFGLRARGGFVVALRDGIWLADAQGRLERKVADAPYDPAHHRFNDGRVDRQGRFWAGVMNERRDANSGALHRLDADFVLHRVLDDMMISNGLAWSPDGRTMYHSDTPTLTVRAFPFDPATGMPGEPRVFARWNEATDRPDGAAVDSAGHYWVAFYRGGKVVELDTSGRIVREVPVPAMCPTMCAFGGADLRTLYVTSARQLRPDDELARYPQSGGVFAMRVDVPGLPEPRFAG